MQHGINLFVHGNVLWKKMDYDVSTSVYSYYYLLLHNPELGQHGLEVPLHSLANGLGLFSLLLLLLLPGVTTQEAYAIIVISLLQG